MPSLREDAYNMPSWTVCPDASACKPQPRTPSPRLHLYTSNTLSKTSNSHPARPAAEQASDGPTSPRPKCQAASKNPSPASVSPYPHPSNTLSTPYSASTTQPLLRCPCFITGIRDSLVSSQSRDSAISHVATFTSSANPIDKP
jgi:hypothetical protein